jgi:hypothetical protein
MFFPITGDYRFGVLTFSQLTVVYCLSGRWITQGARVKVRGIDRYY